MIPFDEAFNNALAGRKYDILAGRAPNIRQKASDFVYGLFEKYIIPLVQRLRFNFPDISGGADARLILNIFIAVIAAAALAASFFIFKRLAKRPPVKKSMREIFDGLENRTVTYDKLLSDAALLARKGMYRDAIRFEFISLLWVFNIKNLIYLSDYKTNSLLKNEIETNAPPLHDRFSRIVNCFNVSWFGHKTVNEDAYRDNRSNINELIREAHKL